MRQLFYEMEDFNENISLWDVFVCYDYGMDVRLWCPQGKAKKLC